MRWIAAIAAVVTLIAIGCAELAPSKGGGQTKAAGGRRPIPADIALPPGYRIEAVATGLTYPSGVAFDDQNRPHVVEAGYCYGEDFREARLIRIDGGGAYTVIAASKDGVPWTGVDYQKGAFVVAQGGVLTNGRIVRIDGNGTIRVYADKLPSVGDHHTNGPAIAPDGSIYFAVGTATNSGVVGEDNYQFGWLKRHPQFHDVPPRDIKLAGRNFKTPDLLKDSKNETETGAFVPFGTRTQQGQVVRAAPVGTGTIYRIAPTGGSPQLVAWGLRNPFGLRFAADGSLIVAENSYDVRGSRPVWGTGDLLWRIDPTQPAMWYGWPDFHGGEPLEWDDHFQPPGKPAPKFVLAEHPNAPPKPMAKLGVHCGAGGVDISRGGKFGFDGQIFVALFGDMAPPVGKVNEPVGFQVVRVEPQTGVIHAFAVNRGKKNGPASMLKSDGLERPVDVRFDRTGEALYVVDFGVVKMSKSGAMPKPGTGMLWRITREVNR
jgi:glucose/arabinose dehydrogenase